MLNLFRAKSKWQMMLAVGTKTANTWTSKTIRCEIYNLLILPHWKLKIWLSLLIDDQRSFIAPPWWPPNFPPFSPSLHSIFSLASKIVAIRDLNTYLQECDIRRHSPVGPSWYQLIPWALVHIPGLSNVTVGNVPSSTEAFVICLLTTQLRNSVLACTERTTFTITPLPACDFHVPEMTTGRRFLESCSPPYVSIEPTFFDNSKGKLSG